MNNEEKEVMVAIRIAEMLVALDLESTDKDSWKKLWRIKLTKQEIPPTHCVYIPPSQ